MIDFETGKAVPVYPGLYKVGTDLPYGSYSFIPEALCSVKVVNTDTAESPELFSKYADAQEQLYLGLHESGLLLTFSEKAAMEKLGE